MSNLPYDVYLAGPDVFLPNALEISAEKKRICASYGLIGKSPLDNEIALDPANPVASVSEIFAKNCGAMDQSRTVIANFTPFRGLSADVGTAFEVGYMFAQGKPVFAYTNTAGAYAERAERLGVRDPASGLDAHGMRFEDFGLPENLMLAVSALACGSGVVGREVPAERLFTDLSAFTDCVKLAAEHLLTERLRTGTSGSDSRSAMLSR